MRKDTQTNVIVNGYSSLKKKHEPANFFHRQRRTMPSQAALGTTTNELDSPEITDDEEERDTSLDRGGSPVRN